MRRDDESCEVWRVTVGGLDRDALFAMLRSANVRMNPHAERLLTSSAFALKGAERTLDVVALSVADLGLPDGATMPAILDAARERGLAPGPPELGPRLRLLLRDEEESAPGASTGRAPPGSITVVMTPLSDDASVPRGFYLRRIAGERWLRGYCADDAHRWSPKDRLAFVVVG
jgi:hypothetical protein